MKDPSRRPIGVLVMAYGGPNELAEVEPYLLDVRGFRPTAAHIIEEVRERYRAIGGRSPILERTREQAAALDAALNAESGGPDSAPFAAFVGMRHWRPYIREALAEMGKAGITRAVGLVMAPHYSRMSVGAYFEKVAEAGSPIQIARVERWHLLPGYIDAVARRVGEALARFLPERRAGVTVLFTAHSLPERILAWDDPYPRELRESVEAVRRRLGEQPCELAYQSAAMTPEPWLGPDAGEVIARLAAEDRRDVIIAPIGFTTEHVEILYDIDIELQRRARALGVQLERIEMVNDDREMIQDLAGLISRMATDSAWSGESSRTDAG